MSYLNANVRHNLERDPFRAFSGKYHLPFFLGRPPYRVLGLRQIHPEEEG
jgi:hypothetical protein